MKKLAVFIIVMCSVFGVTKMDAQVGVGVSITVAPPVLPVYAQPPCPGDGYLWSPGYWAYGPNGYYWVPGVWVVAPQVGFLWTPGYWGFVNGGYFWHGGYWGPHVGFYGGVCYGYGYGGVGFYGGRWTGGHFFYNSAVWHVGGGIHNTYVDRTVIVNNVNRTSFNGRGGIEAQPTAEERTAMNENHVQPTAAQQSHQHSASINRSQLASVNHGSPATTARSTVGGSRYNSTGHSISRPASSAGHAASPNHPAVHNNAAMHSANNVPRAQPQHMAQPQQQHSMQRMAPARSAPQVGGGGFRGGAGGGHERH